MSKRAESKEKKLALLQAIKEKKHILFGSFAGNKLTASEKEVTWKEIHEYAQSLGLSNLDKKWTHTRDNLFGLWKSRALAKRDNARRTGTGGGKENKTDEVDSTIFDIIDAESPVLDGINVPESSGGAGNCFAQTQQVPRKECDFQVKLSVPQSSSSQRNANRKRKTDPPKEDAVKKLKEELLKIEIYKAKLKVFQLEKVLKLPASEFTKGLAEKLRKIESNLDLTPTCSSLPTPLCNYSGNSSYATESESE